MSDGGIDAPRTNLPFPSTSFVGRAPDVARLTQLLRDHRLVTVTGAGGIGKTRTALAVGEALLEAADTAVTEFGVWLVELASLAPASSVEEAVARALSVAQTRNAPLLDTLLAHLKPKALLLVLDNCEHLVAQAAFVAERLLHGCPKLRILGTSREPLHISGEYTYRLPSLGVPTAGEALGLDAQGALAYPAVELFAQRARASDQRFRLAGDNPPIVAEICRRLDGIPLAIELAAARTTVLPVQAIAMKLGERFDLLSGGLRTALPRHQTMRALIDWSYDQLAPPEQRLFEGLSIFAGGCTLAAAAAVYAHGADDLNVLDVLSSLVDKSLVVADLTPNEPRYGLPESSRQYASQKLAARGDLLAWRHRHAAAFLALAEQLEHDYDGSSDQDWLARAEPELENFIAVLDWTLVARGDVLLGQRLAGAMRPIWMNLSLAGGQRWLQRALDLIDDRTPAEVEAALGFAAASLTYWQGEYEQTFARSHALVATFEEIGNALGAARARYLAGESLVCLGRVSEGEPMLRQALEAARSLGNLRLVGLLLGSVAYASSVPGNPTQARAHIAEAIDIWRAIGAERNEANAAVVLAEAEFLAGHVELAIDLATSALKTLRELGARPFVVPFLAQALQNLAAYEIAQNRFDVARAHAREALKLAQERQLRASTAFALQRLAAIAALSRDTGSPNSALELAARLLAYVDARLAALGSFREFTEQQEYDRAQSVLCRNIDAQALSDLAAQGAAMEQAEAIEAAHLV